VKLATEAPVNGGRNYNGPKVNTLDTCLRAVVLHTLALVKSNYMLETPHTAV